jgi:hypothetical protein
VSRALLTRSPNVPLCEPTGPLSAWGLIPGDGSGTDHRRETQPATRQWRSWLNRSTRIWGLGFASVPTSDGPLAVRRPQRAPLGPLFVLAYGKAPALEYAGAIGKRNQASEYWLAPSVSQRCRDSTTALSAAVAPPQRLTGMGEAPGGRLSRSFVVGSERLGGRPDRRQKHL